MTNTAAFVSTVCRSPLTVWVSVATLTTSVPKLRAVRSSCAKARGVEPIQAVAVRTRSPEICVRVRFIDCEGNPEARSEFKAKA